MKYIVYKTTNLVNNKIYIGVHKTENPDIFDGYIGCGAYKNKPSSYNKSNYYLHRAIVKYGVDNFVRTTIKIFNTEEEAYKMESEIVNEEFIKREDTYNTALGGQIPPITCKTIYQFDLDGNILKVWDSITDIITYYKCNKDRISMCIKDKRSFDNCYWSDISSIDVKDFRLSYREKVFQYDSSGNLLNTFNNATEASEKLKISLKNISNSLYEKNKYGEYYFLHSDDDINVVINNVEDRKRKNRTPVYRHLKNNKFDKEYESMSEAARENNTSTGNIIKAIKKGTCCSGYKWSYVKSEYITKYVEKTKDVIKIAQYSKNGDLIKIWDSVSECQKEFPLCRKVCNGTRKTTGGYVFKYID